MPESGAPGYTSDGGTRPGYPVPRGPNTTNATLARPPAENDFGGSPPNVSGWFPLTLGTKVEDIGNASNPKAFSPPAFRVNGDRVELRGVVQVKSAQTLGAGEQLAEIPSLFAEYRPNRAAYLNLISTSGALRLVVAQAGGMTFPGNSVGELIALSFDGLSFPLTP